MRSKTGDTAATKLTAAARVLPAGSFARLCFPFGPIGPEHVAGPFPSLAPPLLLAELRGERVPKQISAEATNGELVSN